MPSYFKKLVRVRVPSLLLLFKSSLRTILFFLDRETSHDQIQFLRSLRAAAWVEAALSAPTQLAGRARPHRRGPHCSAKQVCVVPQGRVSLPMPCASGGTSLLELLGRALFFIPLICGRHKLQFPESSILGGSYCALALACLSKYLVCHGIFFWVHWHSELFIFPRP